MKIHPVPMFTDNYAYILEPRSGEAAVVDPAQPLAVLEACKQLGLELTTVLTTHRHRDHAGGNLQLKELLPGIIIVAGQGDNVPGATVEVADQQQIQIGSVKVTCLATPFHTNGHVCYMCEEQEGAPQPPALFSGDTLFIAGCGRCFWGTPEQMHETLVGVLAKLPGETQVYCGHEYTVDNLHFAAGVEPSNTAIQDKLQWAEEQEASGRPTVPSTIQEELSYNPFLRCHLPEVQASVGCSDPVATLAALRSRKDHSSGMATTMTIATQAIVAAQKVAAKLGLPFHYL